VNLVLVSALGVIAVNLVLSGLRAVLGPTVFDRVLALDVITLNLTGGVILLSILFRTPLFMDLVLVIALLGFTGPVALAAYLEGSLVDDRR